MPGSSPSLQDDSTSLTVELHAQDTSAALSPTGAAEAKRRSHRSDLSPNHRGAARGNGNGNGSSRSVSPRSSRQRAQQQQDLQLPGCVSEPIPPPSQPTSPSNNGAVRTDASRAGSRRRTGGGYSLPVTRSTAGLLLDDSPPPAAAADIASPSRRSTGPRRAAPVMSVVSPLVGVDGLASPAVPVLVGEHELNAQIRSLMQSEGGRGWLEREAAQAKQKDEEQEARRSSYKRKSLDAQGAQGSQFADAFAKAAAANNVMTPSDTVSGLQFSPAASPTSDKLFTFNARAASAVASSPAAATSASAQSSNIEMSSP
jgi:hypothetical protein